MIHRRFPSIDRLEILSEPTTESAIGVVIGAYSKAIRKESSILGGGIDRVMRATFR
jgi:hypothetical protein